MSPTLITPATVAVVADVASFPRGLRTRPTDDRRLPDPSRVGPAGFAAHAPIVFEGAFPVAQRSAVAAIDGPCRLGRAGRLSKAA